MNKLSERNIALLTNGSRITGSMTEGYYYAEEQLYCDEAKELLEFCKWVDKEIGGCSAYNIQMLFRAFKHPEDKTAQIGAMLLKERIAEIKNL